MIYIKKFLLSSEKVPVRHTSAYHHKEALVNCVSLYFGFSNASITSERFL